MSMEKLFEKIDSEILDDETKKSIQNEFNESVKIKAIDLAKEKLVLEKEEMQSEFDSKLDEYKQQTSDRISEYMELVVEQYLKDNKVTIDENIKIAQVDALLEGFDSMLVAGGVQMHQITEATDDSKLGKEVQDLTEEVNTLVESTSKLKKHNKKLIKMGLINEVSSDLTMIEKDKFEKLAEMVELNSADTATYMSKLLTLAESVKGAKEEKEEEFNESKDEQLTESYSYKTPSWAL